MNGWLQEQWARLVEEMRDALEQARRADVYPGDVHDILSKYGMDFHNW